MTKFYTYINTSLGDILILSNSKVLTGLYFSNEKYIPQLGRNYQHEPKLSIFQSAEEQLNAYAGKVNKAFELPYLLMGTSFQQKVWKALLNIPYGKTVSYKELALTVDAGKGVRAVASAVGRNPISVIVPCHRVIGSNGSLTGYAAGIEVKRRLLELELGN